MRVKSLFQFSQKFQKDLQKQKEILLVSHTPPDLDTVCSQTAFYLGLKKKWPRKKIFLYNESEPEYFQSWLHDHFAKEKLNLKTPFQIKTHLPENLPKLWFFFEINHPARIGNLLQTKWALVKPIVYNLDHHQTYYLRKTIYYLDSQIASCTLLVYYLLKIWRVRIDSKIKKLILAGFLRDSGGLIRLKSKKDLWSLEELFSDEISYLKFYKKAAGYNIEALKTAVQLFRRGEIDFKNKILFSEIKQTEREKSSGLWSLLSRIKDFDHIIIYEKRGTIGYVHLRSDSLDVSKIAKKFGGGGHKTAAAFYTRLPKTKVFSQLKVYFQK